MLLVRASVAHLSQVTSSDSTRPKMGMRSDAELKKQLRIKTEMSQVPGVTGMHTKRATTIDS